MFSASTLGLSSDACRLKAARWKKKKMMMVTMLMPLMMTLMLVMIFQHWWQVVPSATTVKALIHLLPSWAGTRVKTTVAQPASTTIAIFFLVKKHNRCFFFNFAPRVGRNSTSFWSFATLMRANEGQDLWGCQLYRLSLGTFELTTRERRKMWLCFLERIYISGHISKI